MVTRIALEPITVPQHTPFLTISSLTHFITPYTLPHSQYHSLNHCTTPYTLTHSQHHTLTASLTHSLYHTLHTCTQSHTHKLTASLAHSITHSLTQVCLVSLAPILRRSLTQFRYFCILHTTQPNTRHRYCHSLSLLPPVSE
jgi:hypothetical protein